MPYTMGVHGSPGADWQPR